MKLIVSFFKNRQFKEELIKWVRIVLGNYVFWIMFFVICCSIEDVGGGVFVSISVFVAFFMALLSGTAIYGFLTCFRKSKEKVTDHKEKEVETKKNEEENIIKEEKARTAIEKYKFTEIGSWMILPSLLLILLIIAGAIDYFLISKSFNPCLAIPAVILGGLIGLVYEIDENWKERLKCKEKILEEDTNYKWTRYEYNCVYTDSVWLYLGYQTAKVVIYLLSILAGGIIIILLFMWIGSLAPATIIIILLIMILLK